MSGYKNQTQFLGSINFYRFINYSDLQVVFPEPLKNKITSEFVLIDLAGKRSLIPNLIKDSLNLILIRLDGLNNLKNELPGGCHIKFIVISPNQYLSADLMENGRVHDWFIGMPNPEKLAFSIFRAKKNFLAEISRESMEKTLGLNQKNLEELNQIGAALSAELNMDKLLNMILDKAMDITSSDAGSLYLAAESAANRNSKNYKKLLFKLSKNASVEVPFSEFTIEINRKSICGTVALTGDLWNIPDVYNLPADSEIKAHKQFDSAIKYRSMSMLTIPMKSHENEVIGVIQLINKKRRKNVRINTPALTKRYVIPYNGSDESIALSLASQAAVALENARLYKNITNLFEGFIKASVIAIESRDPTTSGHSERVAELTVALAKKINEQKTGPFAEISYSENELRELRYAALLHDFGKIGVQENVLVKSHKLFAEEIENIRLRVENAKKCRELFYADKKLRLLENTGNDKTQEMSALDKALSGELEEMDRIMEFIVHCNEPLPLTDNELEKLLDINRTVFSDNVHDDIKLVPEDKLKRLCIKKGSLSYRERLQMQLHVSHSFKFLCQIPWTRELKRVPEIAFAHHEKLDGTGYPRRIKKEHISLESQIMCIADIYDALTASDRPYKKAIPAQRALEIIGYEVKEGKIDNGLYGLFVEKKVYDVLEGRMVGTQGQDIENGKY
ncbi:MAG: HD domain-containing phosphohydrolase [bacterium]